MDELLDEIFNTTSESVDFEITFAAFLSAGLLANPSVSPPLTTFTYGAGLTLLLITLIRRMAVINQFSLSSKIIQNTTPVLVILSTYTGLYFALGAGTYLTQWITINPLYLALITLFSSIVLLAVLYELLFRDFFLLMAIYSYKRYQGPVVKSKYGETVLDAIKNTLATSALQEDEYPSAVNDLRTLESATADENVGQSERFIANLGVRIAVVCFSLLFLLGGAVFVLASPTNSIISQLSIFVIGSLSFLSINVLIVFVQFFYGRYGTMNFQQMASIRYTVALSMFLYFVIGIHLSYFYNLGIDFL